MLTQIKQWNQKTTWNEDLFKSTKYAIVHSLSYVELQQIIRLNEHT